MVKQMEIDNDWWASLLKSNCDESAILEIAEINIKDISKKGENYASALKRVALNVVLNNGKKQKRHLIIKEFPTNATHKHFVETSRIFNKEIAIYREVLPAMEQIMRGNGDVAEPLWCKCLHVRPFDQLILQDLSVSSGEFYISLSKNYPQRYDGKMIQESTSKFFAGEVGYMMKDRTQGLNLEHSLLVVKSLARFHATSVILIDRGLIDIKSFKKHAFLKLQDFIQTFYGEKCLKFVENMDKNWEPEWRPLAITMKTKMMPYIAELITEILRFDKTRFNVLNHGDCWVNNILFKDSGTPESVKFIDFQFSHYNSPALDLQYFIATSTNLEVRRNSKQILIEAYHQSLTEQLKLYSNKIEVVTLHYLLDEMKRCEIYGIVTSIAMLPMMLFCGVKYEERSSNIWENICNSATYSAIMKIILKQALENNVFRDL